VIELESVGRPRQLLRKERRIERRLDDRRVDLPFLGNLAVLVVRQPGHLLNPFVEQAAAGAGVAREDLDLTITEEVVTIKGERKEQSEVKRENYLAQECYWGSFSRSYVLPVPVIADKAQASLSKGILTITIPKEEKTKAKTIEIKTED